MSSGPTLEELTPEAKEEIKNKIKEIEDSILEKINKYNDEIKVAEKEEAQLRTFQNRAYAISERFRKAPRNLSITERNTMEADLNDLDTQIQMSLNETLEAKNTALVSLQALYKEHVEYLSQVVSGLKNRCEQLESASMAARPIVQESSRGSRPDNLVST